MPGKCVYEIKHSGFNKATGVLELMAHEPFRGRRPIFIGDDVTDESVFALMPDLGGLAFSVGRRATGVADHFDEPRDVRQWLARLLDNENAAVRPRSARPIVVAAVKSGRLCERLMLPATTSCCDDLR